MQPFYMKSEMQPCCISHRKRLSVAPKRQRKVGRISGMSRVWWEVSYQAEDLQTASLFL